MSTKSGKSTELWSEAERVASAGEVVMLAKAGGNLAVLRWDKYESLTVEAVAQEAARWREAVFGFLGSIDPVDGTYDERFLGPMRALLSPAPAPKEEKK